MSLFSNACFVQVPARVAYPVSFNGENESIEGLPPGDGLNVDSAKLRELLLGDRTTSLTRSLRVSNARFKAATGWAPAFRSAREGWMETARAIDSTTR